ncbi:unnamed protein product [Natator depressus]
MVISWKLCRIIKRSWDIKLLATLVLLRQSSLKADSILKCEIVENVQADAFSYAVDEVEFLYHLTSVDGITGRSPTPEDTHIPRF